MSASTSTPSAAAAADAPPPPRSVLFARGVLARLSLWPALRIAVDESWGGPSSATKRTWLASVLVDAFESPDETPDTQYVELTLLQVMEDEFDVMLEDGSAEAVARDIVRLWAEAGEGREEWVRELEAQAEKTKGKRIAVERAAGSGSDGESDDGESEGEDEEGGEGAHDAPMLLDEQEQERRARRDEPQVDEDGFTVVKGKGRSHR